MKKEKDPPKKTKFQFYPRILLYIQSRLNCLPLGIAKSDGICGVIVDLMDSVHICIVLPIGKWQFNRCDSLSNDASFEYVCSLSILHALLTNHLVLHKLSLLFRTALQKCNQNSSDKLSQHLHSHSCSCIMYMWSKYIR